MNTSVTSRSSIKPRLVIADIDGTLVTKDKALTPRAVAAVAQVRAAGVLFSIVSSRPPRGLRMIVDALRLTEPFAGFNGGMVLDTAGHVLQEHVLSQSTAEKIVERIESAGLDVWVYAGTEWYVRDLTAPHVEHESWTVQFSPTLIGSFAMLPQRVAKIVGVSDDYDRVAACEKTLQHRSAGRFFAARSQPYYLDVTHRQANKGVVVEMLSRTLKVPAAEILSIGDMPTDTLMFAKSGISVAMGQSSAEVREKATFVTTSNAEEGFALAMEKFILAL